MTWTAFNRWRQQGTTIQGFAGIAGLAVTAGAKIALHDPGAAAELGVLVWAVIHLLLNDNSPAAARDVQQLVTDVVQAELSHRLETAAPMLIAEGLRVIGDLRAAGTAALAKPAAIAVAAPASGAAAA